MVEHLISSTVLPMAVGESFTDYRAIPEAFEELDVSGLEFTFLPEWDPDHTPLGRTAADWKNCPKPTIEELVKTMEEISIPVVHINRDVGDLLCSDDKERIKRGEDILESNLRTAEEFDSKIAVIHLWDTRAEEIDLEELWKRVEPIAEKHDDLAIAVENVPISAEGYDVKRAWNELSGLMDERHGFTLDLNWCSFYDNFERLKEFKDKIIDVHLQGYVSGTDKGLTLKPKKGNFNILEALERFCKEGYDEYVTLEINKPGDIEYFKEAVGLMKEFS